MTAGQPQVIMGNLFSRACRPGPNQFFLGGPGSGSPMHFHNDAVSFDTHYFGERVDGDTSTYNS